MSVINDKLELYRGQRKMWVGTVRNAAGGLVDITGAAVYFTVRTRLPAGTVSDDTDEEVLFKKTVGSGISLSDASNGEFEILIDKPDTDTIEISSTGKAYVYGIALVESGQSDPLVLAQGKFTLKADVVRGV